MEIKKLIQEEILNILDDDIENEIAAMIDFYTVAEIAREVLLSFDRSRRL